MSRTGGAPEKKGAVVLATVQGDIHDIGKNIVKVVLENYGYEVSRKTITDALRRGKLPGSKPVEGGYWEFSIREIVAFAMSKA